MRSLPIVCSVLLVCGVFTANGESVPTTPNVVIDGYTVNSTLNSPATLPLGTTIILVCRISGIPHGLQTNYHWTCPNEPCQQTGYDGRKINNNIIAINITSTSDGGTYICNVTTQGREASKQFQLNVNGGQVVHSYGRLIFHERVITDKQQLQPPNNDSGDGRIDCRASSGSTQRFIYYNVSTGTIYKSTSGSTATVVIRDGAFNNFVNFEGKCAGIYHYLFLSNGALPNVSITGTTSTSTSIKVNFDTIPSGIERVIIGYHRLDLGVPVVGQYGNNYMRSSGTFSSLVPGAKYRITAWGLGGGDDRRRGPSPAVREVTTMEKAPSPPRNLTITRVFDDRIELNWIPPREPNGDIQHYIIKYTTQNGTQQRINTTNNINSYNLTRLERGQTYHNIRVVAVNSAGRRRRSQPKTCSVHNSTVECIKSLGTPKPSLTTSTPSPTTSTPSPTTSTPSPTTSTPSPTTSTPSPTTSTPTDGITVPQDTTDNPTTTSDTGAPIIGAAAGGITLLLVSVLGIIICTTAIVRTRRGKRNRTTLHDQPVLYSTLKGGEKDVHEYTLPTGEQQQDNYNTGGLYDDVDVKIQPQPAIPSGCEVIDDQREGKETAEADNNRKATDTASPNEFYAQPDKKTSKKKNEEEIRKKDIQDPELLYAEVDKPKKKGKVKKVKDKDEHEQQQGELLYAEVNKPKKKGKKEKTKSKKDTRQPEEQHEEATTSHTGLGYEPSADGDSTPQQQDGEGNPTQPTPSATVEGLYAEVDKTQKKNKKKDEE